MNSHAQIETIGTAPAAARALLEVRHLRVEYHTRRGCMVALPDFSLTLHEGESLGLVGESGCGCRCTVNSFPRFPGISVAYLIRL